MKDAHIRIRSAIAGLVVLAFLCSGAKADEATFLSNLHDFRINNFIALNAYYQYSASSDKNTLNEIVEAINAANSAMNAIAENQSSTLTKEQTEKLVIEFDRFKELMRQNINDVRTRGYPDLRLLSDMANQTHALSLLSDEIYRFAREDIELSDNDDRVEAARSAAVTMAQMMSKYSARSNSSVAMNFQGADSEVALDEQARMFDELVNELDQGPASGDLKTALNSVKSKWMFIRGSYINFNDNNVPFIIDRYSRGILKSLGNVIRLLNA